VGKLGEPVVGDVAAQQLVDGSRNQVGGSARRVRRLTRDHVSRLEELHEQVEHLGATGDGPLASVDQRLLGEPREGRGSGRVLEQAVEGGVRGLGPAPGRGDEGGGSGAEGLLGGGVIRASRQSSLDSKWSANTLWLTPARPAMARGLTCS
jgi:hypothetical protein